jgi:hypothetical protein
MFFRVAEAGKRPDKLDLENTGMTGRTLRGRMDHQNSKNATCGYRPAPALPESECERWPTAVLNPRSNDTNHSI